MISSKTFVRPVFLLSVAMALSIHGHAFSQETDKITTGQFPGVDKLPASRFQDELKRLSPAAQLRANALLKNMHFNQEDVPSLHAHADGSICFSCRFAHQNIPAAELQPPPAISEADSAKPPVAIAPFPAESVFHSRPGSPNVLWLNFEGQDVTGTAWNDYVGRALIKARPFSIDSNFIEYSATEQAMIKQIWQRTAEDYAPFDIDVTTERPAVINNRTAICLITGHKDANGKPNPAPDAGGVAYVNVFGIADFITKYSPAFVYHDNLQNRADFIVDAASHEIGHNMGLSHDGISGGESYYAGHGSGNVSWGTIMGVGYNRNVSQWCKGEYYRANNFEDDLAIINAKVGYRLDDHGNTNQNGTPLVITNGTLIESTNPETDPDNINTANKGVIEQTEDVDVFTFTTGTGSILIMADPLVMTTQTKGGNLDILLELYDDGGNLLQSSNPLTQTTAIISADLSQGNYILHVKNTGAGSPTVSPPSGYTDYASLGQYFLSGTIVEVDPLPPVLNALMINNDAIFTTVADVILNHTLSDGIPDEYRASENADMSGAVWLPYTSLPNFTLGGYGTRTVYMQVRNSLGNSLIKSDSINYPDPSDTPILDSMSINNGDATTNTQTVILNHVWTGGVPTQYRASEDPGFAGATWKTYTEELSFVLLDFGARTVYLQLGNSNGTSAVLSDTITYVRPPTISVSYGETSIASGYQVPSSTDGTDFGTMLYRGTSISRTYTVRNIGEMPLSIESLIVPVGFNLAEGLPTSLAAGESDSFTVLLNSNMIGTKLGQIQIANGDASQDMFAYSILGSVEAVVAANTNRVPIAYPTRIRTFEDKQVAFRITGHDPKARPLRFRILEKPKKGILTGIAPNLVYVPDLNTNGRDSFTFEVHNGINKSASARVDLIITAVNDPPIAKNMKVRVPHDKRVVFRLKGSDVDSPLSTLRYKVSGKPKSGSLRWTKSGKVVYVPKKGFEGRVKFKYRITDGTAISETKTVTLIVK